MRGYADDDEPARDAMRRQILVFLDDYCRDLSLGEAGRWYDEVFKDDAAVAFLNLP